jgi:hypothetical protein
VDNFSQGFWDLFGIFIKYGPFPKLDTGIVLRGSVELERGCERSFSPPCIPPRLTEHPLSELVWAEGHFEDTLANATLLSFLSLLVPPAAGRRTTTTQSLLVSVRARTKPQSWLAVATPVPKQVKQCVHHNNGRRYCNISSPPRCRFRRRMELNPNPTNGYKYSWEPRLGARSLYVAGRFGSVPPLPSILDEGSRAPVDLRINPFYRRQLSFAQQILLATPREYPASGWVLIDLLK